MSSTAPTTTYTYLDGPAAPIATNNETTMAVKRARPDYHEYTDYTDYNGASSSSNSYWGSFPSGWAHQPQQEIPPPPAAAPQNYSWASSNPYQQTPAQPLPVSDVPAYSQAPFAHAPPVHGPVVHDRFVHGPLVHAPVVHAPVVHAPVVHAPVVHAPPVHAPPVHAPPVHAPVVHAPLVHAPLVHAPLVHAPLVHAPSFHAPSVHGSSSPPLSLQPPAPPLKTPAANQWNPTTSSSVMYTPPEDSDLGFSTYKPIPRKKTVTKRRTYDPEGFCVETIDPRFPMIGVKCKYILNIEELKRRCSTPEEMNISTLALLFRKCKTKNYNEQLKKLLEDNGIQIPPMKRQLKLTSFSPLLEQEAKQISEDVKTLTDEHFPTETVAVSMVRKMLEQGKHPQQCLESLNNSILSMNELITSLENRQPMVTGEVGRVKNNALDAKYEHFSRRTHGYGHADSLVHYKSFKKIFEHAARLAHGLLYGQQQLKPKMFQPRDGKPWRFAAETRESKDGR